MQSERHLMTPGVRSGTDVDVYGTEGNGNDFKFQLTEESKNLLKHRIEENMFSSQNPIIEDEASTALVDPVDQIESPLVPVASSGSLVE